MANNVYEIRNDYSADPCGFISTTIGHLEVQEVWKKIDEDEEYDGDQSPFERLIAVLKTIDPDTKEVVITEIIYP